MRNALFAILSNIPWVLKRKDVEVGKIVLQNSIAVNDTRASIALQHRRDSAAIQYNVFSRAKTLGEGDCRNSRYRYYGGGEMRL